ncbi:MAG: lipid-A-disaccharide synthase [Gemmatimonadaceae bacterium]|nr:lipid-A-disaccharide synthase [Gemmatimonadaceae bacterium]
MREVLVIAGEASGDLHGAGLVRALRAMRPDLTFAGIGGRHMREAGVTLIEDAERMAVMGVVEVLRTIPHHYRVLRRLDARLASGKVGLVIPIDYPGFNMKVAAAARQHDVPVLYYITPQVWAWGAGRLPRLAQLITRAATILPFEAPLLLAHGIDATFVGHPLLDRAGDLPSREAARAQLGIPPHAPLLALFPGSRQQEIARHLGAFVETARLMEARQPGLRVVVSVAATVALDASRCPYPLVPNASFSVLRAADAALCKSGTTTLEAAVAGCPLIVAYRTSGWTYAIARRAVKIPRIGLVNVVADREVAPEFVQDAMQPARMAAVLEPLLNHGSEERAAMLAGLAEVRARLGEPGAAARTAEMASGMVR